MTDTQCVPVAGVQTAWLVAALVAFLGLGISAAAAGSPPPEPASTRVKPTAPSPAEATPEAAPTPPPAMEAASNPDDEAMLRLLEVLLLYDLLSDFQMFAEESEE